MKSEKYRDGLAVRRQVLGDAYVDRALARADDFSAPLQDCLTEHAWGAVWTRDGLPLKTRSMVTVAMLAAMNRRRELQIHLRGALRNGVTREEIREILLQCGVYCGWPCALDAFELAREVFDENAKAEGTR